MLLPTLVADAPHARAALRVEVTRAAAGKPFLAAVEVDTDPHWHVYWSNPGDSGIPTKINWHAPKGWRIEPLDYPAPHRFAPGGVAAYGYEGKALFLARVTPSVTSGTLSASVHWLVCANACVPGSANVSARLTAGSRAIPSRDSAKLEAAYASLPEPAAGWTVRAVKGKAGLVLTAIPPKGAVPRTTVEFFPSESGVIDHAKPAVATSEGGRFVFKMDASPFPEPKARLKGLLVFSGIRRQALSIAPKIETGEKP